MTVFLVWICTVRTFLFLFCCLHPTVLTSLVNMFSYWKGDDFRVSLRVSGSEKSSWSASCGCPEVHRPMEIVVPRRGLMTRISPSPSPGTPPPSAAPAGVLRGKNEKFPFGANLKAKKAPFFLAFNEYHLWLQGTWTMLKHEYHLRDAPTNHQIIQANLKLAACWWCFWLCQGSFLATSEPQMISNDGCLVQRAQQSQNLDRVAEKTSGVRSSFFVTLSFQVTNCLKMQLFVEICFILNQE